ncbi:MAG TPA: AMP-binding protein, partial [Candidatus Thermoplasmatota archaeon]|nr:AMP-binding protein [Candidatus Thermoplasmatota archaeon]
MPRALHDACVDQHAARRPDDLALVAVDRAGRASSWSFADVQHASARLAHHLRHAEGVRPGDRVVVVLPQRVESALAHLAC